ncbi:EAL domain-containing protein [bacterium]|nr:EAL domain-containing protein [bacterium]MBU1994271.1 EAL domain-containing protein [bacterium]
MSLFKQIASLFTIFIVSTLVVVFFLSFKSTNEFIQNQLYSDAQDTATSLGLSISMVADDAQSNSKMDTIINAIFDSGYYQSIVLKDRDGKVMIEKHNPKKVKTVPQWFMNVIKLQNAVGTSQIMAGWRQFGTIDVYNHNGHAYYQLWTTLFGLVAWFVAIVIILFLLLYLLLHLVLRPVKKVQQQADSILKNNFIITDDVPFTTELRGITEAMNLIVLRIKEIYEREAVAIKNYHDLLYTDEEFQIPNRKFLMMTLHNSIKEHNQHAYGALGIMTIENYEALKSRYGYYEFNNFLHELLDAIPIIPIVARSKTLIARMNVSDFAVMCPGIHEQNGYSELGNEIMQTAKLISQKHFIDDTESIRLYMGIGAYEPNQSIVTTLSHIDHALMKAKMEDSFSCHTFCYDSSIANFQNHGKDELITRIRDAMTHNHIQLASQQCLDVSNQQTFHHELFARFYTSEGELIPARHFLPVVYSAGLLDEIDLYLLHKICKATPKCAMNLSAPTFEKTRFLQELTTLYRGKKISPMLQFETTLAIVQANPDAVEHFVENLHLMNFTFGIDGFIFDMQEAELLKKIRPDYIKMNAQYLCELFEKDINSRIFNSIYNLTLSIGIKMIVSNVETKEEYTQLEKFGIIYMQGFYIHKPELLQEQFPL